jgi:nicotinamidase-related amidase
MIDLHYLSSHQALLDPIHSTKLKMSAVSKSSRAVGKLTPSSTAFLFCDIQEGFRPLIHNSETIVTTAQYLTSTASELDIPIIATQQYTQVFGPTVSECFANGQEGVDDLISKKRVFEKKNFSMMTDEVVECIHNDDELKERDSFVLFGIEAHVCVQQTCLDLLEMGKEVHVVCDGVSSQQPYDREIALQRMETAGAFLTTAQSLTFMLMQCKSS